MRQQPLDLSVLRPATEISESVIAVLRAQLGAPSRFDVLAVAYSGGKDSSVLLALTLEAARREGAEHGSVRPVVVLNSDTRIENPLVERLVRGERAKVLDYARRHGVEVHWLTAQPMRAASWAVKVIGGNALPPMPGGKRWCSNDWKIEPVRRALNGWLRERGLDRSRVLTCTGTRRSESQERGRKMALRGESATRPTRSAAGDWILSPLADLDTDQVWEVIGEMRGGGLPPSYTDFDGVLAVYSSAGGSSCPLIADYRMGGEEIGGCEARTGCWGCTAVSHDAGLANMLAEHAYLAPLYAIREWVAAVLWDYERRSWVGRTIDAHGYITIAPDGLSGATCAELLRYCLSADADEEDWARRHGQPRRFAPIVNLESLILIDFGWSLHGIQGRPYEAWRIYREIVQEGTRYYPPRLAARPRGPLPEPRYLQVGEGWEAVRHWWGCGLRDLLAEALEQETASAYPLRVLADGREILDIERGDCTDVDLESIDTWDYLQFLHEENVEAAARGEMGHAEAVRVYLSFGVVRHPDHGQIDRMLRRVAFRERAGIGRDASLERVWARTISRGDYERLTGCAGMVTNLEMDLVA